MAAFMGSEQGPAQKDKPLMELAEKRWKKEFHYELPTWPLSIRVIKQRLYCCQSDGIAMYDSKFHPVDTIPNGDMGNIRDVIDISGTDLAVAAYKGLFQLNHDGKMLHTIDTGDFSSVQILDGLLYASEWNTSTIRVYDQTQSWLQRHSFKPACDLSIDYHSITLSVSDNMIVSACSNEHKIRCWSLKVGPFYTIGKKGTEPGMFDNPRLCCMDNDLTMLVADCGNHRLQAVNSKGKNCVFKLPNEIKNLRRAVCFNDKLVIACHDPNLLTVLTHD